MISFKNKIGAIRHLESLWEGMPEAIYGARILNFIAENLTAKYIPMNLLLEMGDRKDDSVISRVVSYLTGAEMQLLSVNLEFIDEEHVRFLDPDEASAATNYNINPVTGESDPYIESKLFIYFSPTPIALEMLAR